MTAAMTRLRPRELFREPFREGEGVVFGGRPGSNAVRGMRQLTQRYAGTTVHAD